MRRRVLGLFLFGMSLTAHTQSDTYPHNAASCDRCHSVPIKFGGSSMTVHRIGEIAAGRFMPAAEGGIHHRNGESSHILASANHIIGERVSLNVTVRARRIDIAEFMEV